MKSLARLITAVSLAGSCFAGSALAQTDDGADGAAGAKGLFFEQLSHPSDNLNTGIQYWIELHHDGQIIHATNKTAFHTGDKIRFHVRPNIDGYAYIMLKSGSRGEQAVLFPSKGRDENNKITRGKEIVLPDDGMLSFDENPGTEKLTLIVSRKPIDTESYLSTAVASSKVPAESSFKEPGEASSKEPPSENTAPPLVAMAASGSKDLIPNQVLVAYLPSSSGVPESVKAAAAKASKQAASTGSKQQEATSQKSSAAGSASGSISSSKVSSKSNSTTKSGSTTAPSSSLDSASSATEESKVRTTKSSHKGTASKGAKHQTVASATSHATEPGAQTKRSALNAGLVTVVFKNPDSVLAADISLEHL
jgi:Domain of unknown function (DUF4384)